MPTEEALPTDDNDDGGYAFDHVIDGYIYHYDVDAFDHQHLVHHHHVDSPCADRCAVVGGR